MVTKTDKLKTIIKWYDILLARKEIRENYYKRFMYAILNVDDSTVDRIYKECLIELDKNGDI